MPVCLSPTWPSDSKIGENPSCLVPGSASISGRRSIGMLRSNSVRWQLRPWKATSGGIGDGIARVALHESLRSRSRGPQRDLDGVVFRHERVGDIFHELLEQHRDRVLHLETSVRNLPSSTSSDTPSRTAVQQSFWQALQSPLPPSLRWPLALKAHAR